MRFSERCFNVLSLKYYTYSVNTSERTQCVPIRKNNLRQNADFLMLNTANLGFVYLYTDNLLYLSVFIRVLPLFKVILHLPEIQKFMKSACTVSTCRQVTSYIQHINHKIYCSLHLSLLMHTVVTDHINFLKILQIILRSMDIIKCRG